MVLACGGRQLAAPLPSLALPASKGLRKRRSLAFCVYTTGNVDGRHSGTIKFLEAAG